ncbi:MAG: DNA-formamidopyrimidine glycosylase family protein, partial [Gemmatimonadota bacterium]|nr:DNA-formamidopyrimidine glycosylase family protein [Gemmatimonadota bacterium]
MPELPDLTVYLEALELRVPGEPCVAARATSPFVVRSVAPPPGVLAGHRVTALGRRGKRLVLSFDGDLHLVIHLMVAGRLQWSDKPPKANRRILFLLEFPRGTLVLTEAGTKKRASVHVVAGAAGLAAFDRGGLEPLDAGIAEFGARLRSENHTLKRALTDPRLFAGIGNAYSDEILHRAKLSPLLLTSRITDDEVA